MDAQRLIDATTASWTFTLRSNQLSRRDDIGRIQKFADLQRYIDSRLRSLDELDVS